MIWRMNTLSEIQSRLSAMTQNERKAIAESIGVPFDTVQKVATGATPDPRYSTWSRLAAHFGIVCAVPPQPTFCEDQ